MIVQGIGKEHIFFDDDCKGYYLSCLQLAKNKYPVKILGFCVMGNHAHVLLAVKDVSELSAFFRIANSKYASYYNRRNNRTGYVFRDRFKSQTIFDERYLVYCLAYVHNNPLKAGMVEYAGDYGYSSYTNYLYNKGIVDFEEARKYYDVSAENIMAIMQEGTNMDWLEHEGGGGNGEDTEKVLLELLERFGYRRGERVDDIEAAANITREMQLRCGTKIKEMARMLGVGRESLRRKVVEGTGAATT